MKATEKQIDYILNLWNRISSKDKEGYYHLEWL